MGNLPDYVQAWLNTTGEEPAAETFLREAAEWDANVKYAGSCGNHELACLSRSRAAAMREAAAIVESQ